MKIRISKAIAKEYGMRFGNAEGSPYASWPTIEGEHKVSIDVGKAMQLDAAGMKTVLSVPPAVRMAYRAMEDQIGKVLEIEAMIGKGEIHPGYRDGFIIDPGVSHAKQDDELTELDPVEIMLPVQARTVFDEESINELAEDIRCNGLINPVTVRRNYNNSNPPRAYILIAGERRVRACKRAKIKVLARIIDVDQQTARRIHLSENIQREDLCLEDRVKAVADLYKDLGNMQAVADQVKKSKAWVSKHVAASMNVGYWARKVMEEGLSEDLEVIGLVSQLEASSPAGTNMMWSVVEKMKSKEMSREQLRDKLREVKDKKKEKVEARDVKSKAREDEEAARGVVAPGRTAPTLKQEPPAPTLSLVIQAESANDSRKEPTAQVWVPMATRSGARQIADVALSVARECMRDRHPCATLDVSVLGIKIRRAVRSGGAHTETIYEGPMIWASATDGAIKEEFCVSFDGAFYVAI